MGNKFSRRREAPVSSAAAAAASEQKPAVESSTTPKPTADSAIKQEAVRTETLDVLVEEPPKYECAPEGKEEESPVTLAPPEDAGSELLAKETPAPVQLEAAVSDTNPLEPGSFAPAKPEATEEAEAAITPNPEDVPEPDSALQSEADTDLVSEPTGLRDEDVVQHQDQESSTDPVISSPPLIDFGVPDVISSPTTIHLDPDESLNVSASEHSATAEPEKLTSDFLEKSTGVEAEECLKTLGSDINVENVSELLKNSGLKENDLLSDIIPREVKIPDDTSITDMSTSMELM
ncbi:proteoglycan 4-like [Poecilia reticulata]|uniref:proteoglycan 4-like n=1 Tax=Poecilia reticulata TaxID=8081 RepID=UPI0004A39347|nr:PREDICTED: proteoglycan 4-like [Poecilia reticulata]